jgi:CHAT domain-containing protein
MQRIGWLAIGWVVLVTLLGSAVAQTRSPAEVVAEADRLIAQASNFEDRKEFAPAAVLLQRAVATLEKEAPDQWKPLEGALLVWARLVEKDKRPSEAIAILERALVLAKGHRSPSSPALGIIHIYMAFNYTAMRNFQKAAGSYSDGLDIIEYALIDDVDLVSRVALNNLAFVYLMTGEPDMAIATCNRWLAFENSRQGPKHPRLTKALRQLGTVHEASGDFLAAAQWYRKALALAEAAVLPSDPMVAELRREVASVEPVSTEAEIAFLLERSHALYQSGEMQPAIALAKRALASTQRFTQVSSARSAQIMNFLAVEYEANKNYSWALLLYNRALNILEKLAQTDPGERVSLGSLLNNLAGLYSKQGEQIKAEQAWIRALSLCGRYDMGTFIIQFNLVELYIKNKQYQKAIEIGQQIISSRAEITGETYKTAKKVLYALGEGLEAERRYAEAEPYYQTDLQLAQRFLGPTHRHLAVVMNDLAELYKKMGRYGQAEPLYQQAIAIEASTLGLDHPERAVTIYNLAGLYVAQQRLAEAEKEYQRAVEILKRTPLPSQRKGVLAGVLLQLGDLQVQRGTTTAAEATYKSLLDVQRQTDGPEHPSLAPILDRLAMLYRQQNLLAKAEPLAKQALALATRAEDADRHTLSTLRNNLAVIYVDQKKYELAIALLEDVLKTGATSPSADRALGLANLAQAESLRGQKTRAENLYRQAVGICDTLPADDDPNGSCAQAWVGLGQLCSERSHDDEAGQLLQRALAATQRGSGPLSSQSRAVLAQLLRHHIKLGRYDLAARATQEMLAQSDQAVGAGDLQSATLVTTLANLLMQQGNYQDAEQVARRAITTIESHGGKDHPALYEPLLVLANVYRQIRQLDKALAVAQRALVIAEGQKDSQPRTLDTVLNVQGLIYIDQHQLALAERVLRQRKALKEARGEVQDSDYAVALNNLALVYLHWGQLKKAEPLLRQAIAIGEKTLNAIDPQLATWRDNLARVYHDHDQHEQAAAMREQVLAVYEKTLGSQHPEVLITLRNLAAVRWQQRDFPAVVRLLERALAIDESISAQLATEERITRWRIDNSDQMTFSLIGQGYAQAQNLALATALLHKGRSLDLSARHSRLVLAAQKNPTLAPLVQQLQAARSQLEGLIWARQEATPDSKQHMDRLQAQVRELEEKLALQAPSLQKAEDLPAPSHVVARVAAALPKDGALIEIIRTFRTDTKDTEAGAGQSHNVYIALLLFPDGKVESKVLADAAQIDTAVSQLLAEIRTPSGNPQPAARALHKLVMEPLQPLLPGCKRLYVSPEGMLQLVPWAALHDGSRYLLDAFQSIVYLTSGRDLLRQGGTPARSTPLLIGAPDYQQMRDLLSGDPLAASPRAQGLYLAVHAAVPLPGTRQEVAELAALMPSARQWLDGFASEVALKKEQAPLLLHIATHGVFLDSPTLAQVGTQPQRSLVALDPRPGGSTTSADASSPALPIDNPMSRAALLFAGAAKADDSSNPESDGILTAQEASMMDLWGTQLTVLSACDTARGNVAQGEGVYGLRRAFFIAGSETLVASAWPVADRETGSLMTRYYRLLLAGRSRAEAMHVAARALRGKQPHPYFWAPFMVFGQDSPLRLPGRDAKRKKR